MSLGSTSMILNVNNICERIHWKQEITQNINGPGSVLLSLFNNVSFPALFQGTCKFRTIENELIGSEVLERHHMHPMMKHVKRLGSPHGTYISYGSNGLQAIMLMLLQSDQVWVWRRRHCLSRIVTKPTKWRVRPAKTSMIRVFAVRSMGS